MMVACDSESTESDRRRDRGSAATEETQEISEPTTVSEPTETTATQAQYQIIRWDCSYVKEDGASAENYYYDYLQLEGNSPAFQKINETLYAKAEKYMTEYTDGREVASYGMGDSGYSRASTKVTFNNNGVLSINIVSNSFTGGVRDYTETTQLCFDLTTGEIVTLLELTGLDEERFLNEFRRITYEQAKIAYGASLDANADVAINAWNVNVFNGLFYIEQDGQIWLKISSYTLSDGATGGRSLPTGFYVGGSSGTIVEQKDYKVPIILLHGRVSNTANFFGVHTNIGPNTNYYYGTDHETLYTTPRNHKITSVDDHTLGQYLVQQLGYEPNKNLFAFNYPNIDMVEMNGKRLAQYVNGLVEAAMDGDSMSDDFVDPNYLFRTQEDREAGRVKFILIGHSMGGLVARYYIENINDTYVEKLITICTPHYGSGLAEASDLADLPFVPCDLDLQPDSWLFGNEQQENFSFKWSAEEYAYLNQSKPLKGNLDLDVQYYAIGGYDADSGDDLSPELEAILDRGEAVLVPFKRNITNKSNYRADINKALDDLYEGSKLDLSDVDGDNVVDHMSQFAVKFNQFGSLGAQRLADTIMIISSGYNKFENDKRFHNEIAKEPLLYEAVQRFIEA